MADNLRDTLRALRGALVEAEKVPPVPGGEASEEDLLLAANSWRSFIRQGDNFLDVVQDVTEAAYMAVGGQSDIERRRAVVDVSRALHVAKTTMMRAYGDFAEGREAFYRCAKAWSLSTKRSSYKGKPKTLADLKPVTVVEEMKQGAQKLSAALGKALDKGAKAQTMLREKAKGSAVDPAEIVNVSLDFRDAVSEGCFARVNGVLRRAAELSSRAWEAMKYESKDAQVVWKAPWANDPEIGDTEEI